MPELPEVETVRRTLKKGVIGLGIQKILVLEKKTVHKESLSIRLMAKRKIVNIHRRAKLLILEMSGGFSLVVHLKMTGQLIFQARGGGVAIGGHPIKGGADHLPNRFTRIVFTLTKGNKLFFNDVRKFGYLRLLKTKSLDRLFNELKLGPEPLESWGSFEDFKFKLKKRPNSQIKNLLLDQSFVAGLGNIYADEVVHQTRIKPTRRIKSLTIAEQKRVFKAIPDILKLAIQKKGTTIQDYRDGLGSQGRMQKYLKVYQRTNQACPRCGHMIIRKKIGSRSAHYCSNCQK